MSSVTVHVDPADEIVRLARDLGLSTGESWADAVRFLRDVLIGQSALPVSAHPGGTWEDPMPCFFPGHPADEHHHLIDDPEQWGYDPDGCDGAWYLSA